MERHTTDAFRNKQSRRIIGTPSPAARSAFFYMQETGCLKADDASSTRRQNLDSYLFVAVISGRGELAVGEDIYTVNRGECFLIDCRTPHYYRSSEKDPWELMWIHFSGSTSAEYYDYFISQSGNVFRTAAFERAVSVLSEIISVNELQKPNSEVITSKLIVELLTIAIASAGEQDEYDSALHRKLVSVHSYIEENFSEDLTLEKLAEKFYISKYYLTREYKKIYGKTIFQHIISLRISCGKQLLRFSDKSIEEIAHLCGFNDQSYFARQFKKSENLTCISYRKMWRD